MSYRDVLKDAMKTKSPLPSLTQFDAFIYELKDDMYQNAKRGKSVICVRVDDQYVDQLCVWCQQQQLQFDKAMGKNYYNIGWSD